MISDEFVNELIVVVRIVQVLQEARLLLRFDAVPSPNAHLLRALQVEMQRRPSLLW